MPRSKTIRKIMVIGSGPIVIGQAAEFDYAGTQACRTLKAEGFEVVLINSNPATIMTDQEMADKVYIEPLQIDVIERILRDEQVDALLATLGGQTGLNFAMELSENGFLAAQGIRLLGTQADGIARGEDRELFREAMLELGLPLVASQTASDYVTARASALEIGFPVIVRPAFTLGGTGGGIAHDEAELAEFVESGLSASRVHQVLIEKCIAGWKELEFEIVRDGKGQKIAVCSMENLDPVGIHTGDSIVVAPAQTLDAAALAMLKQAAFDIVDCLEIQGGCNVQFAYEPVSRNFAVIEVNPRLSRSSALASKATGYPIAKIATKIALGYTLDEIPRDSRGGTAYYEPDIDYIVTKIPKWPFDKFVHAKRALGTQMKATGEVMALGHTFETSLLKAVRSLELNLMNLELPGMSDCTTDDLLYQVCHVDDRRLFALAACMRRNISDDELAALTSIDPWFLRGIRRIIDVEERLRDRGLPDDELLRAAFEIGLTETGIARLAGCAAADVLARKEALGLVTAFRQVDTCIGEAKVAAPYLYSVPGGTSEVSRTERKKALVIGSGPIRIGQGIEFDYCSVHSVQALQAAGYEAIIVNSNPETVSTDFDMSDRLYFEPLTLDDVRNVIAFEKPAGVICQFGGQTAIKLIQQISDLGVPILGTPAAGVDAAEDRERFDAILEQCGIERPAGTTVLTTAEAIAAAKVIGYPVLVRPSYVLGGQGMAIVYSDADMRDYMEIIQLQVQEHPILIDKYLAGTELEVDAVYDGSDILIPGIMEHLERAGIHSGDSISIFPAYISAQVRDEIVKATRQLAEAIGVIGLINIQFILYNTQLYVIEVNPRSSRTIPYISKVTGIPLVRIATDVMLGRRLQDLGFGTGLYAVYPSVYAVKVPVFSFAKLHDVDTSLGPEMKSTGEVLGLSDRYGEAMYKAILASGFDFPKRGEGILLTVRDSDKAELVPLADRLFSMGYDLYATGGTANYLLNQGVPASFLRKIEEGEPNVLDAIRSGKIKLLVNTEQATGSVRDESGFRLRRQAIEHGIPTITSLDTLTAVTDCLHWQLQPDQLTITDMASFAARVAGTRLLDRPADEL